MARSSTCFRNRKTRAVGLSNELLAAAEFAKDPDLIVFVPVGGTGPIDILRQRRSILMMSRHKTFVVMVGRLHEGEPLNKRD